MSRCFLDFRFAGSAGALALACAALAPVLAAVAVPAPAFAQARAYAPDLSCAAVANLVATHGAVVLGTGPNTYDRYVRDLSFCAGGGEALKPEWVRSRDRPQCFVGYTCYMPSRESSPR